MKTLFLVCCICLAGYYASAQTVILANSSKTAPVREAYVPVDKNYDLIAFPPDYQQRAQFPGGSEQLEKFIQEELEYPETARRYAVEGTVKLRLKINAYGKISQCEVLESLSPECDEAARNVINNMPIWSPAQQGSYYVNSHQHLTIRFSLQ